MTGQLTLRGVPRSIAQDSWWLTVEDNAQTEEQPRRGVPRSSGSLLPESEYRMALILLALTALGDFLFWQYQPGLSLALFAFVVFAAVLLCSPPQSARNATRPALLLLASALPVIEHYQALSTLFLGLGTLMAVSWLRQEPDTPLLDLLSATGKLAKSLPLGGIRNFLALLRSRGDSSGPQRALLLQALRNWGFPLGGTFLLLSLLVEANPVLEQQLAGLMELDFDLATLIRRFLFWIGLALVISPVLTGPHPAKATPQKAEDTPEAVDGTAKPAAGRKSWLGLNPGSVLRALVVFNLIMALQTGMDLSILIGGATLPEGITLAEYAHRGAYPLLVTAMLAGAFALAARPFLKSHKALKPLVLIWLAQNALLGVTAYMRLDLYVESFGLTYLRVHSMIWMALVIAGLLLTAWQILRARSNLWLLLRCAALGTATLYAACFVNFAGLIAYQNLTRENPNQIDWYYICTLGPMAAKSVQLAQEERPENHPPSGYANCWPDMNDLLAKQNWREWGFRSWRLRAYAAPQTTTKAPGHEDPAGR
ncbi:DUF4153 domain-containing protein [Roseobacter sp. SK209-2-6]|uniref:DUF4153 domain-containing protein n=1 Tax=Roseobacter sp. SK209-2-6 TaxID=388739 RepID=UPI0006830A4C|nr:DUF4173 domain-containing protein [Roseobacter sp. SK209-2-6]